MTHFRILKEINDRKYNVPLKEIEDVLNKHCMGIEKNKKLFDMLERADKWLDDNTFENDILK